MLSFPRHLRCIRAFSDVNAHAGGVVSMVRSMLYADPVLTTEVATTQSKHNGSPHVSHTSEFPVQERLLNAREVAARLGVSERWVRDHTTRRSPKIRGVKLGTLMRYRHADVEEFMEKLTTSHSSLQPRLGAS